MHTPEEVKQLVTELAAAAPTIDASDSDTAKTDYENELMPAAESVAKAGRLLYISVDT
jgi:hypothetical protein